MKKFEYTYKALGTICIISIISENENGLNEIINDCYQKTLAFEQEFSRFQYDSVLNKLNREKKQEVSEDFLSLIYKSKIVYTLTDGYFNPLIDVKKIGYSHNFLDNNFEIQAGNEDLDLNQVKNYGKFLEIGQNMNIDFGAIAKGYFAEKMSKYILNKGYKNNLVNLGGDIYASGTNGEGKKWNIGIDSPFGQNEIIASMEISNSSISTSGTYLRNWEILGKKYHHIRNPYSLSCENDFVSVTILHMHGYMSDAIATAVIAMGKTKGIEFCTKNNILFFFVLQNGEIIKRNIL